MRWDSEDLAICFTCGTQFDVPLSSPPKSCRICDVFYDATLVTSSLTPLQDPRQYVPATGQSWTSLAYESDKQRNEFSTDEHDPRIHYINTKSTATGTLPSGLSDPTITRKQLGIGERAILLQTSSGNVLWDLIAFIDEPTVDFIKSKGGLKAIVISHPHFYTTHLEWARIFECPIYLCKADQEWLNRADKQGVRKWITGTQEVLPGVMAIQAGGHFDGSMFLHWEGKLFIADTMMSVPSGFYHHDRLLGTTSYTFMWSYPNMIPLPPEKIHGIWKALKPFEFDATYGGFLGQNVTRADLKAQVLESMKIFLRTAEHENASVLEETL